MISDNRKKQTVINPGTWVRVRDFEELLKSLDSEGTCEGLPLMDEMVPFCGGIYQVHKYINRVFIESRGIYSHSGSYTLKGVRCDGIAHGGCQRSCALLWKEEWLEPLGMKKVIVDFSGGVTRVKLPFKEGKCHALDSVLLTNAKCLPFWDFRQYFDDLRRGIPLVRLVVMLFHTLFRRAFHKKPFQAEKTANSQRAPSLPGAPVSFESGDRVRVLSRPEIEKQLDKKNRTKGLLFSDAMWKYCGKEFQILKKAEQIVIESTGEVRKLSDTYLLKDNVCDGLAFRGCSRECYWFWRAGWLKRVDSKTEPSDLPEDRTLQGRN